MLTNPNSCSFGCAQMSSYLCLSDKTPKALLLLSAQELEVDSFVRIQLIAHLE